MANNTLNAYNIIYQGNGVGARQDQSDEVTAETR